MSTAPSVKTRRVAGKSDGVDMLSRCESSGDISASTFITIAYILNPMQGYKFIDKEYHTLEELLV